MGQCDDAVGAGASGLLVPVGLTCCRGGSARLPGGCEQIERGLRRVSSRFRPGNRRADTFTNLIANDRIGLIFLIPGKQVTLRVSGRAIIVRDLGVRTRLSAREKVPEFAIVVAIEQVFFHGAKCMIRSGLWTPASWPAVAGLATLAETLVAAGKPEESVEQLRCGPISYASTPVNTMTFLLPLLLLVCAPALAGGPAQTDYPNPLIRQRADPHILRHNDGFYYFMGTVPEYDRLILRRARSIEGLAAAEEKVIWRKHATGPMGAHIWAPEIHHIDGKWFIYFAAGEAERIWNIRMYVLENAAANPLEGEWIERGRLDTGWDSFSLDASTFVHRGRRYLVWAQKAPDIRGNTNLYIAKMDSPLSIRQPAVMISKPDLPWEQVRFWVNEGPVALQRNGRIFLTYSAAGTGPEYCLGMLTADEDADLLDPKSWRKSPEPVFGTSEQNGIYGPGHHSFTVAPDGTDLLVYHARSYKEIQGDPLKDPNRHTRVQPVRWRADGTPDFGVPRPDDRTDRNAR